MPIFDVPPPLAPEVRLFCFALSVVLVALGTLILHIVKVRAQKKHRGANDSETQPADIKETEPRSAEALDTDPTANADGEVR